MRKIVLAILLMTLSAGVAVAEELTAKLVVPATAGADCAPDAGKGVGLIIWKGVADKRTTKAVGVLKKGDEESDVISSEPVERLVGDGLKTVFEKCGYAVSERTPGVEISAVVDEFFAGSKKGLITGETEAKGLITLNMMRSGRSVELQFGGSVHNKGLKKKSVRMIEQTLSDVLAMMLNEVASTKQFAEAMKDLSK